MVCTQSSRSRRGHPVSSGAVLAILVLAAGCANSARREPAAPKPVTAPVSETGRREVAPEQSPRSLVLPGPAQAAGSSAGQPAEPADQGWRTADASPGGYVVRWRPVEGDVPRNREFELEVELTRGGEALAGERLYVRGWMPDHGHGLVREPTVTDLGEGRYRVTNLLLHMRGLWQLVFDVGEGAERDTLVFELEL